MLRIAPSILSADFSRIGHEISRIPFADLIHCDVMDGRFVPNITFGPKMVGDIKKVTAKELDVHLMIAEPEKYLENFIRAGADYITVHLEATQDPAGCLRIIKKAGVKAGLAVSPDTPVQALAPYISSCDIVVLMSVYPGFGGQKFIESSLSKLRQLKELRDKLSPRAVIEIDGGINMDNINAVVVAGAEMIVAGNAVFGAQNPDEAMQMLLRTATSR